MSARGGEGASLPPGRAYAIRTARPRVRRRLKTPISVGELLGRYITRRRFEAPMRIHRVMAVWRDVVGPLAADRCFPATLLKGRLVVAVTDSIWLQELTYLKPLILERVQALVGAEAVREVHLRVHPGAQSLAQPQPGEAEKEPRDPDVAIEGRPLAPEVASALSQLEEDLERVANPELRRAIRRAFIRHILRAP